MSRDGQLSRSRSLFAREGGHGMGQTGLRGQGRPLAWGHQGLGALGSPLLGGPADSCGRVVPLPGVEGADAPPGPRHARTLLLLRFPAWAAPSLLHTGTLGARVTSAAEYRPGERQRPPRSGGSEARVTELSHKQETLGRDPGFHRDSPSVSVRCLRTVCCAPGATLNHPSPRCLYPRDRHGRPHSTWSWVQMGQSVKLEGGWGGLPSVTAGEKTVGWSEPEIPTDTCEPSQERRGGVGAPG